MFHAQYSIQPGIAVGDSGGFRRLCKESRVVTVGRTRGEEIEILSGLAAGEAVVLDRVGAIIEGTRIERKNG
ncbi:MAG: hypothetical protein IPP40_04990 [bacterium]|nr:hypothetical protein [bacterium]